MGHNDSERESAEKFPDYLNKQFLHVSEFIFEIRLQGQDRIA